MAKSMQNLPQHHSLSSNKKRDYRPNDVRKTQNNIGIASFIWSSIVRPPIYFVVIASQWKIAFTGATPWHRLVIRDATRLLMLRRPYVHVNLMDMTKLWHGNIIRITGPLWGLWPPTNSDYLGAMMFPLLFKTSFWTNKRMACDLEVLTPTWRYCNKWYYN